MPKSFTEKERANINMSLQDACKRSWIECGYRKTSVDKLCQKVGISKGAFYLFYDTKESLFCEVIVAEQNQICNVAEEIMKIDPHVSGVACALKKIYRIYDKNAFLYHADAIDYQLLLERLSEEQQCKLSGVQDRSKQLFLNHEHLVSKKTDDEIASVIYALIMMNKEKNRIPGNHFRVFDLLVDSVIGELFEEG